MKSEETRITQEDIDVAVGKDAIPLTPELMDTIGHALQMNADKFDVVADALINNVEEATRIKNYRCHNNTCAGTWRYVAASAHAHYHSKDYGFVDWYPASNQLMGMALCAKAAKVLGEDPDKEPWN